MATDPPHKGEPGGSGGQGGEGGAGGAGGRGGSDIGEPGGRGGEGGPGGAGRSYGRDDAVSRWLDWTVRAAVVISLVISSLVFAQVNRKAQCNSQFSARATVLTPVADKEREAQRAADNAQAALWLAVNPADKTPKQEARVRALFMTYQAALAARTLAQAEADKARAANPLPTCNI